MKIKKLDEEFEYGKDPVDIHAGLADGVAYNDALKYRKEAEEAIDEKQKETDKVIEEINDRNKGMDEETKKKMKEIHLTEAKEGQPKQVYNQDGEVYSMYDFITNLVARDNPYDDQRPIDAKQIHSFDYISKTLGQNGDEDPAGAVGGDEDGLIVYATEKDRFDELKPVLDKYELWYSEKESRNPKSKYNYSLKIYYPIDPKTKEVASLVDYMAELGLTPEDVIKKPKYRKQASNEAMDDESYMKVQAEEIKMNKKELADYLDKWYHDNIAPKYSAAVEEADFDNEAYLTFRNSLID